MRASKKLLFSLIVGFCMISLNVNAAKASDQICFTLSPEPGFVGTGPTILKLGIVDYGNNHFALSGTDTKHIIVPGLPAIVGLVHGNAEIVNDKIEVSLSATAMSSDNTTSSVYSYHLRLEPTTLSGDYTVSANDSTLRKGPVSLVSCSDI